MKQELGWGGKDFYIRTFWKNELGRLLLSLLIF
jgi:hypothetical protein